MTTLLYLSILWFLCGVCGLIVNRMRISFQLTVPSDRWPAVRAILSGYITFAWETYCLLFPPKFIDDEML